MRNIAMILNVRKNSSRCHNKLLRPFAGTTLMRIALDKLTQLNVDEKYLCAYEEEFKCLERGPNIGLIHRSKESASVDGPLITVFEAVRQINSDYFMFYNPCCAHISVETLQEAITWFKEAHVLSLTSVIKTRDWIFAEDGSVLIDGSTGDTKTSPVSYRVAHAFHIVNKDFFLSTGKYWESLVGDPFLYEISKEEALDIDEEYEFKISEALHENG